MNLSREGLLGFQVGLPALSVQRNVARLLSTFDDKIELNTRVSMTLEEIARSIYQSWFVRCDPVRAKMNGCDLGVPPEVAQLFPGRFVDSEIGDLPEGWSVVPLEQMGRFLNGLALQKFPPVGERSLPVIKIAQLRSGTTDGADRASSDLDPAYIVEDGDLLFSWSGSLECLLWSGGRGALNQHLFKVTSERYPRWFLYLAIHQHLDTFRQIAADKATTMGHIQRRHLAEAKTAVPPPELLRVADAVLAPLIEGVWQRRLESRALAEIRDALLPRVLSGEMLVDMSAEPLGALGP
jgi:type I restriction enzyme S subunit